MQIVSSNDVVNIGPETFNLQSGIKINDSQKRIDTFQRGISFLQNCIQQNRVM